MPSSRRKRPDAPQPESQLTQAILSHLRREDYTPGDTLALCHALRKRVRATNAAICAEIESLERAGTIVRIKGDRFAIPQAADLLTGIIRFRASGSAWVTAEQAVADEDAPPSAPLPSAPDEVQVFQEDAGTSMHGDRVVVRVDRSPRMHRGREVRTGRVIRILERANSDIVGSLQRSRHYFHVVPDDPRLVNDILVPDPARSKLRPIPKVGDKVVVRLADWIQRHAPPEGEITAVLGRNTEPGTELRAIFIKHKLPQTFPEAVLAEVRDLPTTVPAGELRGREDFRSVPTCTIDPDDARDFDDALSLETLADGSLRIGVHIADVSAYVRQGTALDREARQRGNSTYLIGTVVPMLPEKLSNGLCSLVEGEDRLTRAVIFTFDRAGRMVSSRCAATVIRSRKRLTYRQAFALLRQDSLAAIKSVKPPPAHQTGSPGRPLAELADAELLDLQKMVRTLWKIASRLREERMRHGSLDLEMPETKIFVDEQGWADRIERIEHDESHQLIEEFMLLANEAVASVTRRKRLPSVYRVHEEPDPAKLQDFRDFAASAGLNPGSLQKREHVVRLLADLRKHPQGHTLRSQFLRSLRKACYKVEPLGHYGLHKSDYTHFTSPIRRYSDLIVHRVVAHGGSDEAKRPAGRPPHGTSELISLAQHISLTEINSAEAEREHHKIKLVEFFERDIERNPRTSFPAVITDVRNHGLFIELTEPFMPGFIHVSSLRDDFYSITPDGAAMVGRRHHRRLELGQSVRVEIDRVDRIKRQFDFRPIEAAPEPEGKRPQKASKDRNATGDEASRHARSVSREQRQQRSKGGRRR